MSHLLAPERPAPPGRAPFFAEPRERSAAPGSVDVDESVVRCVTINTHRGQGPNTSYLKRGLDGDGARRVDLLEATRAWSFHIADWIRQRRDRYHVVALQEVYHGGVPLFRVSGRQRDYYRVFCGYPFAEAHRVGFAAFRYENVLLSRLAADGRATLASALPCRVFRLATCGFTLAPFRMRGRTVWVGNTHLHAYDPRARMRQAAAIAREVRKLGDAPVLFLGDLNTVPPGCKDGGFADGDRDERSYKGDRTLDILARAGLRTIEHVDGPSFWSYPVGAPNRTLDYVLATRHFDIEDYRVVSGFEYSDHAPVEGTFRLLD